MVTNDYTEHIKNNFTNDSFPQKLGIKLEDLRAGYAKLSLEIKDDMSNFHGITHGGALFTLADTAFGLASNTRGIAVALQVSINFLKATQPGNRLVAIAKEEYLTKSTGIYNITVLHNDSIVALMRGTVYRKKQSDHNHK